jgi:hypothetical protein
MMHRDLSNQTEVQIWAKIGFEIKNLAADQKDFHTKLILNPTRHGVKDDPRSHGGGGLLYFKPGRFLAVSLHKSILLYIRTSHSRGNVSSFKTLDLGAFQKSNSKAPKSSASKFVKEKLKKKRGLLSFEGRQTKSAMTFYVKIA